MTINLTDSSAPPAKLKIAGGATTAILVSVAFLNHLDRVVMAPILEPIKKTFDLSDMQAGALSGIGFGIAYAVLGVPFARVADFTNRKVVITGALAAWSLLTVVCGFATGFWCFFLARLGVGIGEAAGTPALHSLIADRSRPDKRAGAASLLSVAMAAGAITGIVLGGVIAEHFGWRASFWIVGAPGLAVAGLAILFLEDNRAPKGPVRLSALFGRSMWSACGWALAKPAFRWTLLGHISMSFWLYGTAAWFPTFLLRSHHLSLSQVAVSYGILSGGASMLGAALGGFLGNRLTVLAVSWYGWFPAGAAVIAAILTLPAYFIQNTWLAMAFYIVANVFNGAMVPVIYAGVYALSGARHRALGIALLNFFAYLVGVGAGPVAVGALSDAFAPRFGDASLAISLMAIVVALPCSAIFLALAARRFRYDVEAD